MKPIETTQTTPALKYTRTVKTADGGKLVIKCRLNDECRNGHEDFSLTADIYDKRGVDIGGGCCHDEILAVAPEFAQFARLHLSDANGCPMHAASNGFYWYCGTRPDGCGNKYHGGSGPDGKTPEKCREILKDHLRATDEQLAAIDAMNPRNKNEFSHALEKLGFRNQWKIEAAAAIAQLERWTGAVFETKAIKSQWPKLSDADIEQIEERRRNGYYSAEQVAARDAAKGAEQIEKRVNEIHSDFAKTVEKLERAKKTKLYFASRGIDDGNVIYYDHTNELSFNWSRSSKLWTREEFDSFVAGAVAAELPDGVKFVFNTKPKY